MFIRAGVTGVPIFIYFQTYVVYTV